MRLPHGTRDLGGILDGDSLKLIPNRVGNGAGSEGVLKCRFFKRTAADQHKPPGAGVLQMINGSLKIQEASDESFAGLKTGTQGAGPVGSGGNEGFAGDLIGGVFAR